MRGGGLTSVVIHREWPRFDSVQISGLVHQIKIIHIMGPCPETAAFTLLQSSTAQFRDVRLEINLTSQKFIFITMLVGKMKL